METHLWEQRRSSLQPFSAETAQYSRAKPCTYQTDSGLKWGFPGSNPRSRARVRRVLVSPSTLMAIVDPTRMPFWRRPVSTFGRLRMTDLNPNFRLEFYINH